MQKIGIDTGAVYYESSRMLHGSLKNIMGTRFDLLLIGQKRGESRAIWNDIASELRRLDRLFNRFDEASEVSMINREAVRGVVQVSSEMMVILQNCQDYHARTLGLFDVTLTNFSTVLLDTRTNSVAFSQEDIALDFGGYAKGYALSTIKHLIHLAGVEDCFVDFGNSSILGIGHHPYGDSWKVGVENPYRQDELLDEISLRDQALSVSGNTPSYTEHIVRPASGEAIGERKLVSITSSDPLEAEVLSTVFMIANEEEKAFITKEFKIQHVAEYNL